MKEIIAFWTTELARLRDIATPMQTDIERCKEGMRVLSSIESESAIELQSQIRTLYDAWCADHERSIRDRVQALRRQNTRTTAERAEFDRLSEIISSQH